MIGKLGRLEEARPSLHRPEGIGTRRIVDPRAHAAVRMIDAHSMKLGEELREARTKERDGVGGIRQQGGVAPRLPFRVRAARRCADRVAWNEERVAAKALSRREA